MKTTLLTIVAILGFAGFSLADTGNNRGTRIVPSHSDAKAKRAAALFAAEAPQSAVATSNSGGLPLMPPSNDACSGAIVIPSVSFPVRTAPVDITEATPQGGDDPDVCASIGVDQTVWWSFTPTISGSYLISTCAGAGAADSNVYDTVVGVFDACSGGTTLKCDDSSACPAAVPGAPYVDQGTASAVLTAGTTYYIAAGHWSGDVGGVAPGFNQIALQVSLSPAPPNDTCSAPTPLTLDRITLGTTADATNDYRSPNSCFNGFGQIPSTSNGVDVVFSFTPPNNDVYSFRYVQDDSATPLRTQGPVLYLADDCPAPDPSGAAPPHCIAAANRIKDQTPVNHPNNGNRSEELKCVALTGGTTYYLFFDDQFTANPGGPLAVEVTRCRNEVEPNDTTSTATPFAPNSGCFMEGTAAPSGVGHCSGNPARECDRDQKCWTCSADPAAFCADNTGQPTGTTQTAKDAAQAAWQCTTNQGTCGPSAAGGSCVFDSGKDVDFYDLGAPPVGSKIFVGVDTAASNVGDYDLRITTVTDTLGFDDDDGSSWTGANGAVIAGAVADGNELYARVSSLPLIAGNEPYSLFVRIETGAAQNEDLPDNHAIDGQFVFNPATHVTGGGFVKGIMSSNADMDCFKFLAHTGDNILFYSDNNPNRTAGVITNVFPALATLERKLPSNSLFFGQILRNNLTASPGTLTGLTPSVTSEWSHYRARYDGAYLACFTPTSDSISGRVAPPAAAYPLPYQGSISINCAPVPSPAPADVSVTKTGPAGPVRTGDFVQYTITITNNEPTAIAEDVRLFDQLPPEVVFLGATIDNNGLPAGSYACASVPNPGQNDAPLDCTVVSIAPGAHVTFTVNAQVNNCIGAGVTVANSASITSFTADGNLANNTATWSFATSEDGSCRDLACDTSSCIPNTCTINDHCANGVCVTDLVDCDDHSVCTDDFCDPSIPGDPCIHDEEPCLSDGNDCTFVICDPVNFCQYPPRPAGTPCNDFQNCTSNDACDGNSVCVGQSPCDDGLPCTDDFADEQNSCACYHDISFQGTHCDDGNACTLDTTCDGLGGTAANCNGGTAAVPGEVGNGLRVTRSAGSTVIVWSAAHNSTSHDVVRGVVSALPVGPGQGDEVCFGNLASTNLDDPAVPAQGSGFWYLARGDNACGAGAYGAQSNGSPRITTTCP